MIEYKSIEPRETHLLRKKILRPNQPIDQMVYPHDEIDGAIHFGAFCKMVCQGIVSIYPESQNGELDQGQWRIRGMAVEEEMRGQSVGKDLVSLCLTHAKSKNGSQVWCNARTTAIGFYVAIGFEIQGEEFEIEGIGPHFIASIDL